VHFRACALAAAALAAAACGSDGGGNPTRPASSVSATTEYLDSMLTLMETNSINRKTIDWTAFRSRVKAEAVGAQNIPELYGAIRVALGLLADNHSHYLTPDGTIISNLQRGCGQRISGTAAVPARIGYVAVAGFGGNATEATAFADAIQSTIRQADRVDLVGWIVDLRGNIGGNMWPMIAGVGPILGEGTAGFFVDPDGAGTSWGYNNGASILAGHEMQRTSGSYRLIRGEPRVAIFTDGAVVSSGEAVTVAFRKRPATRSFGLPTCGRSTANSAYRLSDGATLALTTAVMADRERTRYGDTIAPDESHTDLTQAVASAAAWLQSQGR
jgi:C-terminal processing protease CtpA/Prc